ncbi:PITH domain-containing protein [Balamuthia mandrillaris]
MGDHHHHGGACAHEHNHEPELERGEEYSLYKYIDTTGVRCLNEQEAGSIVQIFKPWDQRLQTEDKVESDADEQLIIHIPFTASIKLKAICVIGGNNGQSPSKMKAWINRDDIDFANAEEVKPAQEWELHENMNGEIEYPTRITKFQNVTSLTLFFSENFGADTTILYYVGLKGDYQKLSRQPVNVVYEASPQLKDHKLPSEGNQLSRQIQ